MQEKMNPKLKHWLGTPKWEKSEKNIKKHNKERQRRELIEFQNNWTNILNTVLYQLKKLI